MTPEPEPEVPETHTNPMSTTSQFAAHPPESSSIPVLQYQLDSDVNMTSTHLDLAPPTQAVAVSADPSSEPPISSKVDSPSSAHSSLFDAYKEGSNEQGEQMDYIVGHGSDVSDDYGMAIDSDGDEHADSRDISQANNMPEAKSLSDQINLPLTAPVDAHSAKPVSQPGSDAIPTPPSPSIQTNAARLQTLESNIGNTFQMSNETTEAQAYSYEDVSNGGIDIQQLLDNITANAEKNEQTASPDTPSPSFLNLSSKPTSGLPTHSSLPPRPNVSQKRPYDDMQKYHANTPGLPPAASSYRNPAAASAVIDAGAPGTSIDSRGGLPPPPSASFKPPPPSASSPVTSALSSQDAKWGPDVQKLYDQFLENERMYVTEGLWDRFPIGSRLFIGNLPSEKVTKRDIFHVFHPYGKIAQISIKQAYGFVQFNDSGSCYAALGREQGAEVRGKRMHLEISKPQKNTRKADTGAVRRSRSPDYNRGGDRGGRNGQVRNVDRYDGRSAPPMRQDEYGRVSRMRDDYRPARPVTPPRGNQRGRDEYASRRDPYEGRDRRRSRSPLYGNRDGGRDSGRYRERSPSARASEVTEDNDLQIPRRDPRNIPDVQIILVDQLDRAFVDWVEREIRSRGLKVETMLLSHRLSLQTVIGRQVIEGVLAVSKLDMRSQVASKIPIQIYHRQGGVADAVRFDEYEDVDPVTAAELVLREKQNQALLLLQQQQAYQQPQYPPVQPPYQAPYQAQSSAQAVAPVTAAQSLANIVGQLDNGTLQKLLGTLQPPQQVNGVAAQANSALDLANLLGGYTQPPQPQQNYQPPPADPYASILSNPALASLLGNGAPASQVQAQQLQQAQQPQQPQQSAQQVQNIMAQLARFRQ
ncbi:hypothetical protein LZ554_003750 [Drepanopeziza brunnea f. sp. 'monogermtubi']|nr:hypothetical protein LZ554_003750 [Drepanopeziza brunnea f. sp. 'monogermtubi']